VVDLGAILDGSYDPPVPTLGLRTDGVGLLYPGRVHSFSGEPGGGKTWLGLHHVAEIVAGGGSAGMIDYEDGPGAIVARLLALGVPADAVRERFVYVRPEGPVGNVTVPQLVALNLDLWVVDSVGEALAVEGLNPNADEDVAQWYRKVPRRLAAGGAAVELLDHVAKDRETRGSWAIGSQRKLAAIDGAAYTVAVVKAPTKEDDGHLRITCAKDRHGAHRRGQVVAEVLVLNSDGGVSVTVRRPPSEFRPTANMETICRWMEDNALDSPFSVRAIRAAKVKRQTKDDGTTELVGLGAGNVDAALRCLVEEGFVVVDKGAKNAHLHRVERSYRQAEDPRSDAYESGPGSQLEAVKRVAGAASDPERARVSEACPPRVPDTVESVRACVSPAYVVAGTRDTHTTGDSPPNPGEACPDPDEAPGDPGPAHSEPAPWWSGRVTSEQLEAFEP
jgi:hypothetical protein